MFLLDVAALCGGNIQKHRNASCTDILLAEPHHFSDGPRRDGDDLSGVYDTERLAGAPLLNGESFVRHLASDPILVEARRMAGRPPLSSTTSGGPKQQQQQQHVEALAMPPSELVAELPLDHKAGQVVTAHGPHGPLEIVPHLDERPGQTLVYEVKPSPEFQIEVPPGYSPGEGLSFKREDGAMITVAIPPGLKPGCIFEVLPPVLMVRVPRGVREGDTVMFRSGENEWWTAKVPSSLKYGRYFAARLPDPNLRRARR